MDKLTCFKAYDIRGQLGDELNEDIAYRIGRAYGQYLNPKNVVIGGDVRETSQPLKLAIAKGLMDAGVDVIDIGMVGTEEIYFATTNLSTDGGIEVTASHNPIDYNGMKLVREGSKPISGDTGLREIQQLAEQNDFDKIVTKGDIGLVAERQLEWEWEGKEAFIANIDSLAVECEELAQTYIERAKTHRSQQAETAKQADFTKAKEALYTALKYDVENHQAYYNLYVIAKLTQDHKNAEKYRNLHEKYRPDNNAKDTAISAHRVKNPAADHAAAPVVIYDLNRPTIYTEQITTLKPLEEK